MKEFYKYKKSDDFYKKCDKSIKRNLNIGVKNYKSQIENFNNEAESNEIIFESLVYHIMNNTNNILHFT